MYLIPYEYPIQLLSFRGLDIDFLCIFLCGSPIFDGISKYFPKTAPKSIKSISLIIPILN